MTRKLLLLSALAVFLAPLSAVLWPLSSARAGVIAAVWISGLCLFFFFMVALGLLAMWSATLLVLLWGWRASPLDL